MPDLSHAQQPRAQKRLDTKFRYSQGIMTEREFVDLAFKNGWQACFKTWTDYGTGKEKQGFIIDEGNGRSVDCSKAAYDYYHDLVYFAHNPPSPNPHEAH